MKVKIQDMQEFTMDITPMIDCVFLHIAFFMVASAQITQKVLIEVPKADQAKTPEVITGRMDVTIDRSGQFYVGLLKVEEEEQLVSMINERSDEPGFHVYARADAFAEHADTQKLMKLCAANGIISITFATH